MDSSSFPILQPNPPGTFFINPQKNPLQLICRHQKVEEAPPYIYRSSEPTVIESSKKEVMSMTKYNIKESTKLLVWGYVELSWFAVLASDPFHDGSDPNMLGLWRTVWWVKEQAGPWEVSGHQHEWYRRARGRRWW